MQIRGRDDFQMIAKIISGGQTGADRAALDFAISRNIPHGGWCPRGRLAEDGVINQRYHLNETPTANPEQRTEWNVRDSDATVIFSIASELRGGSSKTLEFAMSFRKPCLCLAYRAVGKSAATQLSEFVSSNAVQILNVAGSRASEEPDVGKFVQEVLEEAFGN